MSDLHLDTLVLCYSCNKRMSDKQSVLVEVKPIPGRFYCSGVCRLKTKRIECREIYTELGKIQYTPGLEADL